MLLRCLARCLAVPPFVSSFFLILIGAVLND